MIVTDFQRSVKFVLNEQLDDNRVQYLTGTSSKKFRLELSHIEIYVVCLITHLYI